MDQKLLEIAVSAVAGALTKAAVEPALGAGRQVWQWLCGKLSGDDLRTAEAVEADPAKPSASSKVAGLLQDVLHGNAQAEAELRTLLDAAGSLQAISQTANVSGDNSRFAQVAGDNNKVEIK